MICVKSVRNQNLFGLLLKFAVSHTQALYFLCSDDKYVWALWSIWLEDVRTRKLCYRKEDRAMRPTYGCPESFLDSLTIVREYVFHVFLKIQKNSTFYVFWSVFQKNVKKRNSKIRSFRHCWLFTTWNLHYSSKTMYIYNIYGISSWV